MKTSDSLVQILRAVVGDHSVALHEPVFGGNELRYLGECIESTLVSSVGPFVTRFEKMITDFTGARHAVAVANGTAALQVALTLAGVRTDDEVLVPTLTFVGTANAVCHAGGIPHFVDSEESTLGLDPDTLRRYLGTIGKSESGVLRNRKTGRRIAAVLPVHVFGHPARISSLLSVCAEFGIAVVEDAAESLGSFVGERHTGRFGLLGTLSFNGNKTITTGGGGAIITDDEELAARAKHLTTTAKKAHPWRFDHDVVAWNFRMPNLNAALGCAQMERLAEFLYAKKKLAARYAAAFDGLEGVMFITEPADCRSNYWLNAIRLKGGDLDLRDEVIQTLNNAGIGVRPVWTLMHKLPMYAGNPRAPVPVAEQLETEIVNLPSGFAVASAL